MKCMPYNLPSTRLLARAVVFETQAASTVLYIAPPGASELRQCAGQNDDRKQIDLIDLAR
jgi:hypothetical protein